MLFPLLVSLTITASIIFWRCNSDSTMANRAVIGGAALAVGVYTVNERIKERRVQEEEKEYRQRLEDIELERLRRKLEQEMKKKSSSSKRRQKGSQGINHSEENYLDDEDEVWRTYHEIFDDFLFKTVHAVEEAVKEEKKKQTARHLPLPLLARSGVNNEENSNEEILVGAALSLADYDIIQSTMMRIPSLCPGLGLAKLSEQSIKLICRTFVDEANRNCPFDDYSDIREMFHLGALSKEAHNGEPVVFPITTPRNNLQDFLDLVHSLDMYVISENKFTSGITGKVGKPNLRLKYALTSRSKDNFVGRGEKAFLCNFESSFSLPAYTTPDGNISFAFTSIKIVNDGNRKTVIKKPRQQKAIKILASYTATKTVKTAAVRLRKLLSCRQQNSDGGIGTSSGISLAHIATECGASCEILQDLIDNDIALIEGNTIKIIDVISSKLEKCVPCPGDDSVPFPINDSISNKSASSEESREKEISIFVGNYIHLLNLSCCEIPRLAGRYPSACVNEISVRAEAEGGIFERPPLMAHRIRRILELGERTR